MARNIRLTPYDEQLFGEFDEDATGLDLTAYGSTLPMTTDSDLLPEDPMPLFLAADDEEEPRARRFGSGGDGSLNSAVGPRIFKAGVFVAVAAAIAFALSSVENPLALFANAKASLNSSPADQVAATPPSQPVAGVQPASSGPPTPVVPSTVGIAAAAPAAQAAPTREDLALALKTARCRRTRQSAETRQGPDRGRRHRASPTAAGACGGRAGGQRGAAAGTDLRPGGARSAGHAQHHARSGQGARLVPEGGAARLSGCEAAPGSNAELAFSSKRGQQCDDYLRWRYSP